MQPRPSNASQVGADPAVGAAGRTSLVWLYAIWGVLTAGLLVDSQTVAFTADEGFHMVAAQLIKAGMRPYLDFCFPQTPLNAYWNAFWMRVFGESWRTAHALASLETSAATVLAAQFVLTRLPERAWRVAGAIAAAMMVGCSIIVVDFGPVGQAYGMCLFTTVVAFRLTVAAVDRRSAWLAGAAGALAGAAVASSLLSAALAPVFLVWLWWCNRAGRRWMKAAAFAAGAAVPFLPVVWLFLRAPWVVWFNLAQYHLQYRAVYWPDPLPHDVETLTAWLNDSQSLLLGLLAVFGVVYIAKRSGWSRERRGEFLLCGWLALANAAELTCTHPTFTRYFCLLVPFLGILAVPGLYAIGSRVLQPERPFWPVLIISLVAAGALARNIYDSRSDTTWRQYEDAARKLAAVTPPGKQMFAEDLLYFLTRHRPPSGMEFDYSHKLTLPQERLAQLHVTTESELKRQLAAGVFSSAATCDDDDDEEYGLEQTFQKKEMVHDCPVYWDWKAPAPAAK
jgi:4-amino-4-deoxy-L-arabinose transferase-like glycosyltransferase